MADSIQPVLLNSGLNTVTPAPMVEPGTLIDCLNYEMTADIGYRRIDGYESYDGWVNGDLVDYYRVTIDATLDPTVIAALTPGVVFTNTTDDVIRGVVLALTNVVGNTATLVYAPANNESPIVLNGATLGTTTTGPTRFVATAQATRGSATDNADTFVANVRAYSTILRNQITQYNTAVAGLFYHRNNLIVALDTEILLYSDSSSTSRNQVAVGSIVGYLTKIYRVVAKENASGSTTVNIWLEPIGTQANNTSLRVYFQDATTISTTQATASGFTLTAQASEQAYLIAANTPETASARGYRLIPRSVWLHYTDGTTGTKNYRLGYKMQIANSAGTASMYGSVISHITDLGGDYSAGTGEGWIEIVPLQFPGTGNNKLHPAVGDKFMIESVDPAITPGNTIMHVVWSQIAGSRSLRIKKSRYNGISANFYGKEEYLEAYLATGASRAAHVRAYQDPLTNPPKNPPAGAISLIDVDRVDFAWGSIMTINLDAPNTPSQVETTDIPKYVQYHQGSLALGFERGSVMRSVAGQPVHFAGIAGGMEIATGDAITGMLEAVDNSLVVFGRRAIRRIVGSTDEDIGMKTIVSNAGCFDYTACNLGAQMMFTGPDGVSTIDQAQEYGDFRGSRATASVMNTLVPKLITDYSDTEVGGVAMAMICRNKNQYRLFMTTGEVYSVTITVDGPKVMRSNYLGIPFAWTSELADSMKEHMMVTWDYIAAQNNIQADGLALPIPNAKRVYEFDRGWGFNGVMMDAYFDLAFLYPTKGVQTTDVEKVRLFGMGHGYSKLDVKTAGMETDFEQSYHTAVQDISLPSTRGAFYPAMRPVTAIIDQQNWGLGIKLRINNTTAPGSTETEPPVICQVLNLHVRTQGAIDG